MITAQESQTFQHFAATKLQPMHHTAFLESEKNYQSVCSPHTSTVNAAFPEQFSCEICGLNNGFIKPRLAYCNCAYAYSTLRSPLPLGHGVTHESNDATLTPQKRFLIFDQSGNHTRLFIRHSMAHQNEIIMPKIPSSFPGKLAVQIEQQSLANTIMEEKWDENHLSGVEGDVLNDTEEINALLYSDSDYTSTDSVIGFDDENDEVTSKVRATFSINEKVNNDVLLEMNEEVENSNGFGKRKKLLDGNYKRPSQMNADSQQIDPFGFESDDESSYAGAGSCYWIDAIKGEKIGKIRESLKMLETIIPGLNSNNPLDLIDKAIIYLKSLKAQALNLATSQVQTGRISEELRLHTEASELV